MPLGLTASSQSSISRISPLLPNSPSSNSTASGQKLERRLLPSVALQGAVGTLGGFLGFFIVGSANLAGMVRFTMTMLTVAMLSVVLAYALGPVLRLTGRRLFKAGFMLPGILLLLGGGSHTMLAIAFGAFVGLTSSARSWLEMGLLQDDQRDTYAVRAGVAGVALSLAATFAATLLLSSTAENSQYLFSAYGLACIFAGFFLGNRLPDSAPVSLKAPLEVLKQKSFLACFPLFFLQSGLYGVGLSLHASGATASLGNASSFGFVATIATLAGGLALWASCNARNPANRHYWMAAAGLGMMASFLLLGASARIPALFIAYVVLQAAVGPFWAASESVLNQRTLDSDGNLQDRIVVREVVSLGLPDDGARTLLGLFDEASQHGTPGLWRHDDGWRRLPAVRHCAVVAQAGGSTELGRAACLSTSGSQCLAAQ